MAKKQKKAAPNDEFWCVSRLRLYALSVLSFGLYQFYWMYKNWQCVKLKKAQTADEKIYPIYRGVLFGIVWAYPLLYRMTVRFGVHKVKYGVIAVLYVLCLLTVYINFTSVFAYLSLGCIAPLFLLPFQKLINNEGSVGKKVSFVEVMTVAVGLVFGLSLPLISASMRLSPIMSLSEKQRTDFFVASGMIYRYTTLYNQVCTAEGQPLDNYLKKFDEFFVEERGIISHLLKKTDMTFDEFIDQMLDDADKKEALETVYVDLNNLRKILILQMLKENGEISEKEMIWNDEFDQYMTMREACKIIDDNAEYAINATQIDRSIKKYMNDF